MKRLIAITACVLTSTGCTLMPEALQPHQLWKLNRQPPSSHEDAFFSIEDMPTPKSTSFSDDTDAAETASLPTSDPFAQLDD